MRKKYLSALLFGALLFASAGTFTSCKDYDDDIDNLQNQIDKLATKEDMTAKLSQMETAVSDAKASAQEAKTSAQAAMTKAEEALAKAQAAGDNAAVAKNTEAIATLKKQVEEQAAKVASLEKTLGDIEKLKKDIQDALDSQIADFREEMQKMIKQVEELTGYSLNMLTAISFESDAELDLNYARIASPIRYPEFKADGTVSWKTADSYEFGKGLAGAFTVKTGDVNTVPDAMLVKVDPINAAISNDMLSLVNSEGKNLDAYLDMTVSGFSEQLVVSRAVNNTGLREVTAQLKKDVDFDAFDKMVLPDDEHHEITSTTGCTHDYIAYSLAVTDAEKSRTVSSPFDVTIHVLEEAPAANIKTKSTLSSSAASLEHVDGTSIRDYAWSFDSPFGGNAFPITNGEAFQLKVGSSAGKVMASYVVVDINNNYLTAADKVVINSLSISGVDKVVKTNEHAITISGSVSIPVPLKLVTIDYHGKMDVNVFWVKAGTPALMTAAFVATPTEYVATPTAYACENIQPFTVPANAETYSISFTCGEEAHQDAIHTPSVFTNATNSGFSTLLSADQGDVLELLKADKTTAPTSNDEVAYAKFVGKVNLQMMREDKTYEGVVKFYDQNDTYIGCNTIKLTKKLPTAVPANFSEKTNGINNGVMTIYPTPNGTMGEYQLAKGFNNWTPYYNLVINGITDRTTPLGQYNAGTGNGDASTAIIKSIDPSVINDGKSYKTVITYNYGKILYIPEGHGTVVPDAYTVTWNKDFSTKFGCWPVDSKYEWAKEPTVYYREDQLLGEENKSVIKATSPYNTAMNPFDATVTATNEWGTWAEALNATTPIKLITKNNGQDVENEYFTAAFATNGTGWGIQLNKTATNVVLSADVETRVIVTITDRFGHTHDIEIAKFTMKKSH